RRPGLSPGDHIGRLRLHGGAGRGAVPGREGLMAEARIHRALSEIPAADWDALHDGGNPFVAHAFLSGLEATGCLRADWGWTPCHLGLWDGAALLAAVPGYLKTNSHGEFVFD